MNHKMCEIGNRYDAYLDYGVYISVHIHKTMYFLAYLFYLSSVMNTS